MTPMLRGAPVIAICAAALCVTCTYADDDAALVLSSALLAPGAEIDDLLLGDDESWTDAPSSPLRLSRTPPLYADGPFDDGERPEAGVDLFRLADGSLMARIRWTDPTEDLGPTSARYPDVGEAHAYKEHSESVEAFGDAVCVMVPQKRGLHDTYPSMMMGQDAEPVDLYYWRAGQGFTALSAHGRATTQEEPEHELIGGARRREDGWTVVIVLPEMTPQTPLCFAIWDGVKQHRDGVKYFSLWYEAG